MTSILTRRARRAEKTSRDSTSRIQELFDVLFENEKEELNHQENIVTQQLRRSDANAICKKKEIMKSLSQLLRFKIVEIQRRDFIARRVRAQLKSSIEREVYAERR